MFIGIEIGGTKLQILGGNRFAQVESRWKTGILQDRGGAGICEQIHEVLVEIRKTLPTPIQGIGVGFGGPVDRQSGRIARSHQIEGWENFPLKQWLAERSDGAPVVVENDANAAALAEALRGAGEGFPTTFYCNFGSGVGGALVMPGGEIYHGAPPGEMEFGHLRLERDGTTVESRCSGWAVDERIRAACARSPRDSTLARLVLLDPGAESRHLRDAAEAKDPIARHILDEVAADIGFALSHVVQLAHPDVVVLGGGLALIGEPFRAAVESSLRPHIMEVFAPGPQIALAALGEDAVPVGALLLAVRAARNESSE